jgi:hypothetical protein
VTPYHLTLILTHSTKIPTEQLCSPCFKLKRSAGTFVTYLSPHLATAQKTATKDLSLMAPSAGSHARMPQVHSPRKIFGSTPNQAKIQATDACDVISFLSFFSFSVDHISHQTQRNQPCCSTVPLVIFSMDSNASSRLWLLNLDLPSRHLLLVLSQQHLELTCLQISFLTSFSIQIKRCVVSCDMICDY